MKTIANWMAPVVGAALVASLGLPGVALASHHHDACEAHKKKDQTNGMLLGAAAGAVGGNVIAGKHDKTMGTVAGAVVGGVVGAKMGKDKVKCDDHYDDHYGDHHDDHHDDHYDDHHDGH